MTIEWTRMLAGHQHVKGDSTTWVMRSGTTQWVAGIRGLTPEPDRLTYPSSREAREAVERYMAAGLHRLPYSERLQGSVA